MANTSQARKRVRQQVTRRTRTQAARSRFRTTLKKVLSAIQTGDREAAANAYREAEPIIDRTAALGFIHVNKAARHKQRLNARIRALS